VAWVEAAALGQQHPPVQIEARVKDAAAARASSAGPPVGTHSSEADVITEVAG